MFQNINETEKSKETDNNTNILSNVISKKYIILYIITFMISMVGMGYDVSPFSLAIIASCIANEIPIIAILVFALLGNAFGVRCTKHIKLYNNFTYVFCKFFYERT